jgi:acyl carrier protein
MKSIEQIKLDVSNYVSENTFGDKSKLLNDTLIFREGFFDSMGFVSLIAFLEEKFQIQTSDDDLIEENFESINAIVQYIGHKLESN